MFIIQDRMLIPSLQMKVSCSSWRASSEAPGRTSADINEFHEELSFKSPRAMLDALLPADMANVSMGPVKRGLTSSSASFHASSRLDLDWEMGANAGER